MSDTENEAVEVSGVPEEDAKVFQGLRALALQSMANHIKEAEELQGKINDAKTKPSVDLYTKKFNRVKVKFQDEVARLAQIEHTMNINNIPLDAEEVAEEQVTDEEE